MKKINLYLDNCCFNRPYDDQSQIVIKLETEAKIAIQESIKKGEYFLHWSYILDFENTNNPFIERKTEIKKWKELSCSDIEETDAILKRMNKICTLGIKALDSLHISCSIEQNCNYFLTVDKGILKKADTIKGIKVCSPIEFIIEMEERNND
ncbi:MAG: PIN domain protein [Spirochaetia bacterium]|jgi:predicted nucleic acid-binding protein|nr:PIN domain protein [Spirochaetia bacterium]